MTGSRLAALLTIVLATVSVGLAIAAAVAHFPRGLIVLGCIALALAAAWNAILRRGALRALGIAVAIVALAVALILLLAEAVQSRGYHDAKLRTLLDTVPGRRRPVRPRATDPMVRARTP
jgi:hypothetical protein